MTASRHRRWTLVGVWVAFALIFALFVVGVAASALIPFGPPVSFTAVLETIGPRGLVAGHAPWWLYALVLAVSAGPLIVHTFVATQRLRLAVPLLCVVLPLSLVAWSIKGLAQWILVMPVAPYWTAMAILGRQDGEFYADGFLVYCALGWWMLLCCVLVLIELSAARGARQAV
jgi:hypothetical protein